MEGTGGCVLIWQLMLPHRRGKTDVSASAKRGSPSPRAQNKQSHVFMMWCFSVASRKWILPHFQICQEVIQRNTLITKGKSNLEGNGVGTKVPFHCELKGLLALMTTSRFVMIMHTALLGWLVCSQLLFFPFFWKCFSRSISMWFRGRASASLADSFRFNSWPLSWSSLWKMLAKFLVRHCKFSLCWCDIQD